jgi:dihydroflavonol-4-reductase
MDGAELERVNVEGTRQALEAARAAGTPRFVYISSIEALPLASGPYPVDESHGIFPDRTVTAYGRSKARATRLVLDSTGAPPERIVVCPTAFLGPPDYRRSSMGRFILDYLHARLPAYVEGGFDFVDVRDVAAAIVSAVGRRSDGANRYPGNAGAGPGRPAPTSTQRIYILGGEYAGVPDLMAMLEGMTGVPRPPICLPAGIAGSVAPLAERYYRITGRSPRFTRGSMRLLSLEATVDSARARTELGYDPRPLAETLRDTVEWFYRHGYLDDANTVFASDGG